MMRLPWFRHRSPRTVAEAAGMLAAEGPRAMLIAGGTDLLPNMKRRQQTPEVLVSLRRVEGMKRVANGRGLRLGGGLTLSEVIRTAGVRDSYRGLWQAASQVATAQLRNMGTLGGNLCLDTRCSFYNQNHEWREAIGFCMKQGGTTCWVATSNKVCYAVSSTDCAPALIALGARIRLVSAAGERELALADLYRNDGLAPLARRPDEILVEVLLPDGGPWRSSYWKLRRRGAFDFPVLGVAVAARLAADGTVDEARLALGAVSSHPFLAEAGEFLAGRQLTDDVIGEAGKLAAAQAKPMNNADFDLYWRKQVVPQFVGHALREIRGDDMAAVRLRVARQAL